MEPLDSLSPEEQLDHILLAYLKAVEAGHRPDPQEWVQRYPQLADPLAELFADVEHFDQVISPLRGVLGAATGAEGEEGAEPDRAEAFDPTAAPPSRLGDFRILREIGRGGMGIVYEAEQVSIGRRVALKLLPLTSSMDPKWLQRFRNEARAAGQLHHSNIVPVYFVGCERGVQFYAMQFIDGQSLDTLIAELRRQRQEVQAPPPQPPTGARSLAEELASGCWAPDPRPHEGNGKSSSGLSGQGQAYFRTVASLGLQAAEALDHAHRMGVVHRDVKPGNLMVDSKGHLWVTDFGLAQLQSEASLTATGDLLGTLRYMSPEQALAKRVVIDHRTDVYSLGATLYELLTLQPAFGGSDRQELLRQVSFAEPMAPRRINRAMPAELETIVLKAMEKNPADRYGTAQELADDLRRWLDDHPIRARRPSLMQRLRKWGRRHRALVASLAFSLAVVLVTSTVGALVYAGQQRQLAEARAATTDVERQGKEVAQRQLVEIARANELLKGIFRDLDPYTEGGGGLRLQEQLKERVATAAQQLNGEAVGDALTVADLQNALGETLWGLGEPGQALKLFLQARSTREALLGSEHPDTLSTMNNLALAYLQAGEPQAAQRLLEKTFEKRRATLGPDHLATLESMSNLGLIYGREGKHSKALPLLEQTVAKRKRKLGPDHPLTLTSMHRLAVCYANCGQPARGRVLLKETLAKQREKLGPSHPSTLLTMNNLAQGYTADDLEKAISLYEELLEKQKERLGSDHHTSLVSMNNLAFAYLNTGRLSKAQHLFEQTLARQKEKLGPDHPDTLISLNNLAGTCWKSRQLDRSVPLFEELLRRTRKKLGENHGTTLTYQGNLGVNYRDSGHPEKAIPVLEDALKRARDSSGTIPPGLAWIRVALATSYQQGGRLPEAEKIHRQLLQEEQKQSPGSSQAAARMAILGGLLLQEKKYADAELMLGQCLAIREQKQPGDWSTFSTQSMLGEALLGQKKYIEADLLLSKGYRGMKEQEAKIPAPARGRFIEALDRLVQLHQATGNKQEAARWRKALEQAQAAPRKPPAGDQQSPRKGRGETETKPGGG